MRLLNRVGHSYLFIESSYGIRFFRLCSLGNRHWDGDLLAEGLLRNNTCNGMKEGSLGGQRDWTDAVPTKTLVNPFGNSGARMILQSCPELDVGWPEGEDAWPWVRQFLSVVEMEINSHFPFSATGSAFSRQLPTVSWFSVCHSYRELLHLTSQSSRNSLQMAEQSGSIKIQLFWPNMEFFDQRYLLQRAVSGHQACIAVWLLSLLSLLLPFLHRCWFLNKYLASQSPSQCLLSENWTHDVFVEGSLWRKT